MSRPRMTPEMANDIARQNFRKAIKHNRIDLEMSQRELAEMVDMDPSWFSRHLSDPDRIGVGLLRRIVRTLHIDPIVILALVGYTDKEIKQLRERLAA